MAGKKTIIIGASCGYHAAIRISYEMQGKVRELFNSKKEESIRPTNVFSAFNLMDGKLMIVIKGENEKEPDRKIVGTAMAAVLKHSEGAIN
ncbi:MAG: hypothetical protein WCT52_05585 [Candidatus Micrarchaeia archaeon]